MVNLCPLPVTLALAVQYMVHHPDNFGQQWNIELGVTSAIPNPDQGDLFSVHDFQRRQKHEEKSSQEIRLSGLASLGVVVGTLVLAMLLPDTEFGRSGPRPRLRCRLVPLSEDLVPAELLAGSDFRVDDTVPTDGFDGNLSR